MRGLEKKLMEALAIELPPNELEKKHAKEAAEESEGSDEEKTTKK